MNEFKISIEVPRGDFQTHLNLENNKRILFSGRFGIGKTTFIKEFFELHEQDYELFYLSPVNYQVAKNEDIFELIKYDILFDLLDKSLIDEEDDDVNELLSLQFFLLNKSLDDFSEILSLIPIVGQPLSIIGKLIKLHEGYKKYSEKIKKKDTLAILGEYSKKFERGKGSIYEKDFITQIIYGALNKILKTKVLVIDDIDRIDPDHIFRILNIFTSHFDNGGFQEENKFGFDKLVLVCDIHNIRKIFHSKFGQDVDFSGYIDKFFSKSIFHFSLDKEILNGLDDILLIFSKKFEKNIANNISDWVKFIIRDLLQIQSINLRDIHKIPKLNNPFMLVRYYQTEKRETYNDSEFFMIKHIHALREILGNDDQKVVQCFQSCQVLHNHLSNQNRIGYLRNLLPFFDLKNLSLETEIIKEIEIPKIDLRISYTIENLINYGTGYWNYNVKILSSTSINKKVNAKGTEDIEVDSYMFYYLLEKIYTNIVSLG